MKLVKIFIAVVFLSLLGGFGYFAMVDVPVHQSMVSKEIPRENFLND